MANKDSFKDIDVLRLDEEWIRQPRLYHEYACKVADAKLDLDEIKNQLECHRAEVYKQIAANPEKFGLTKVTDATTAYALLSVPSIQELMYSEIDAKHNLAVLDAAVKALEHKKRALEKLVDLHLSDYHSAPRATSSASKEKVDEFEKRLARRGRNRPPQRKD